MRCRRRLLVGGVTEASNFRSMVMLLKTEYDLSWRQVTKNPFYGVIKITHGLSLDEGVLVGTSSGANVWAALQIDNGYNHVVTVLPDRAERYFSTALI